MRHLSLPAEQLRSAVMELRSVGLSFERGKSRCNGLGTILLVRVDTVACGDGFMVSRGNIPSLLS